MNNKPTLDDHSSAENALPTQHNSAEPNAMEQPKATFNFVRCAMELCLCVMLARPAITLLDRYYSPLPSLPQLTLIEDVVSSVDIFRRSSRYSANNEGISIRLKDEWLTYKYLDWFPHPLELREEIKKGDNIRLWVDKGNNDWIWQIEVDQKTLRSYDEVSAAIIHNNRFDWLLGAMLLSCSFLFLARQGRLLIKWRAQKR